MKKSVLLLLAAFSVSSRQATLPDIGAPRYTLKNDQVVQNTGTEGETTSAPNGVGIDATDVIAMTALMVDSILGSNAFSTFNGKPKLILDAKYLVNDSSSIVNKDMLTDRLRVGLMKNSRGQFTIVGRQNVAMVTQEIELKDADVVSGSTQNAKILGADYRLSGRITSIDAVNTQSNLQTRYNQINFELVDLNSSEVVWTDIFSFEKSGTDNVIYQ